MATASEIQEVLPGLYTWQAFCSSAKVELTSHLLSIEGVGYLVDPIRLTKAGLAQLDELPTKISAVFLTNGNHERDAAFYRDRYSVPIYAHPAAATEMSCPTKDFPIELQGLEIIPLPGAGAGEIGVYVAAQRLLIVGDIIINLDSFAFAPLPDKYASNRRQMHESIRRLTTLQVNCVAFAHGLPILTRASERIRALI